MKKRVIILGGSGIGMITASILNQNTDTEVIGFLNDVEPVDSEIGVYKKIKVLGKSDDLPRYLAEPDIFVFVAYVGLLAEKKAFSKVISLGIPRDRYISIIDKTAIIPDGFCSVGNGVLLAPLSQLSTDTTVSDNCMLLPNSFLGHNSFMDVYAHLATNSVVGANVHVGKAVHIGSNATIREKIHLGDFCFIGAGAVVLHDVPDNAIVVGNPARVLRIKE